MAALPKKQIKLTISDFSAQELFVELGRQHKNLSSTVAKLNKDTDTCNKALNTIADDLCPVVCANLIGAYTGFKSSAVKLADSAIVSALKPIEIKFDKYCEEKYSCNYKDKDAEFAQKSSKGEASSFDTELVAPDQGSVEMSGEAQDTDPEL